MYEFKKIPSVVRDYLSGKKRLTPKQTRGLMVGGTIVAGAVCIGLLVYFQNQPLVSADSDVPLAAPAALITDEEYVENDLFASALSSGEYASTVLEKTVDAGVEYVKETLFIGDSNTAGMLNHSATTNVTMDNGIGIVSMGIAHVTSLRCVKFSGMGAVAVPEAIQIMQPRRIVITYGTNDFYMSPEQYAETYIAALDAIKSAYPYSDIIIGSIFPITSNCSYYTVSMPVIEKFNVELVKIAQEKNVRFLNWSEALKDPVTGFCKPEYMAGDGVHLSSKGMQEIFDYFRTHKLDGEDKRPKPLNPIPYREATPAGLLGSGPRTPVEEQEPAAEQDQSGLVTVTFAAGAGGSVSGGSFSVAPGATAGPVTAQPNKGYVFVGWTGAASSSSPTISFTVPASASPGQSFVITALFEPAEAPPKETPKETPKDKPPKDDPPPAEKPPGDDKPPGGDKPPPEKPPDKPPPEEPPPEEPPPEEPPPGDGGNEG